MSRNGQDSKESLRSSHARSRALRSVAPEFGLECSSSDEDVMSCVQRESRGLPGSVVATSGSLGKGVGGVRCLLREENITRSTFHLVCCSIRRES